MSRFEAPSARFRVCRPLRRPHGPVSSGAFTLLELVLVIAIVATLAAIAVPKYARAICRYRAEMAGRRIVADLDLVRHNARFTGSSRTVTFRTAGNRYEIPDLPDINNPALPYTVHLGDEPYLAELVSVDFNTTSSVVFDAYGRPDSGGKIVVRSGQTTQTVLVNADSGEASLQ